MLIYLNLDGTAEKVVPQHIYQGSNNVTQVQAITPFPSTTYLEAAFILPDGSRTAYKPMNYVNNIELKAFTYTIDLDSTVLEQSGDAYIAINAVFSQGNQTSYLVKFIIEQSILPTLPPEPTPSVYDLIMRYIQKNSADILMLEDRVEALEEVTVKRTMIDFTAKNIDGTGYFTKYYSDGTTATFTMALSGTGLATVNGINEVVFNAASFYNIGTVEDPSPIWEIAFPPETIGVTDNKYLCSMEVPQTQEYETGSETAPTAKQGYSTISGSVFKGSDGSLLITGVKTPYNGRLVIYNGVIESQAEEAIEKAEQAIATANTALSNSQQAVSTANTAESNSEQAVSTANTANTNSTNALRASATAIVNSQDALRNSNTAVATSNSANEKADNAVTVAGQAESIANEAKTTADGIDGKATQALTNSENAVATANTANATASTAESNSTTAVNTSTEAKETATTALATANTAINNSTEAKETASTAESNSKTALTNSTTAVSTANNANEKADNAVSSANGAVTTANNAKTTADGIDSKATTALTNSQNAVNTANSANTTAEQAVADTEEIKTPYVETVTQWINSNGIYGKVITAETHGKGSNPSVTVLNNSGKVIGMSVLIAPTGAVLIQSLENITIKVIINY